MALNTQADLWNSLRFSIFTGCWEFSGKLDKDGYGYFFYDHERIRAHRAAWQFTFGPIPDDKIVCHSCDNPPCCNPNHLWLGTQLDNQLDCKAKGRGRTGSRNGRAVITEQDVKNIQIQLTLGRSGSAIGRDYGLSPSTIWRIKVGKGWAHVRPEAA